MFKLVLVLFTILVAMFCKKQFIHARNAFRKYRMHKNWLAKNFGTPNDEDINDLFAETFVLVGVLLLLFGCIYLIINSNAHEINFSNLPGIR